MLQKSVMYIKANGSSWTFFKEAFHNVSLRKSAREVSWERQRWHTGEEVKLVEMYSNQVTVALFYHKGKLTDDSRMKLALAAFVAPNMEENRVAR